MSDGRGRNVALQLFNEWKKVCQEIADTDGDLFVAALSGDEKAHAQLSTKKDRLSALLMKIEKALSEG